MKRNDDVEQLRGMCGKIGFKPFLAIIHVPVPECYKQYDSLLATPSKLCHSPGNFAKICLDDFAYQPYFKTCRFL